MQVVFSNRKHFNLIGPNPADHSDTSYTTAAELADLITLWENVPDVLFGSCLVSGEQVKDTKG